MAKAFINDENLTDIADAIRATLDESRQYLPSEMAAAIDSIPIMAQLKRKKYFQSVPAGAASGYATIEQVEGNTVAWNQLVDTGSTSVAVQSGHVYYGNINGTASIATSDGTPISVTGGTDIIHDLTLIFGAGNEPTTVADFESWLAQNIGTLPYYDYNAGELLSVKMSGMQTQDANSQTLDTIALDVTTITGINPNTNTREIMFSSGMKQADYAGTVKDALDLRSDTATVKGKNEKLTDLSWIKVIPEAGHWYFQASVSDIANYSASQIGKIICNAYITGKATIGDGYRKRISTYTQGGDSYLRIFDEDCSTETDLVTANPNTTIIYELATPITYTDLQDANGNPLNPRYKVEQGGTEQVLPVNTSSPTTVAPTLSTIYKKNI